MSSASGELYVPTPMTHICSLDHLRSDSHLNTQQATGDKTKGEAEIGKERRGTLSALDLSDQGPGITVPFGRVSRIDPPSAFPRLGIADNSILTREVVPIAACYPDPGRGWWCSVVPWPTLR